MKDNRNYEIEIKIPVITFTASGSRPHELAEEKDERGNTIFKTGFATVPLDIRFDDLPEGLRISLHDFVLQAYVDMRNGKE